MKDANHTKSDNKRLELRISQQVEYPIMDNNEVDKINRRIMIANKAFYLVLPILKKIRTGN